MGPDLLCWVVEPIVKEPHTDSMLTGGRRIGLVIRYVSPRVAQTTGDEDFAVVVRGENTTGNLQSVPAPPRTSIRLCSPCSTG